MPFQIIKKINPVAFQLDLPPNSKVHPVFHVSLLKSYYEPIPPATLSTLPSETASTTVLTSKAILDHRTITIGSHHFEQV